MIKILIISAKIKFHGKNFFDIFLLNKLVKITKAIFGNKADIPPLIDANPNLGFLIANKKTNNKIISNCINNSLLFILKLHSVANKIGFLLFSLKNIITIEGLLI